MGFLTKVGGKVLHGNSIFFCRGKIKWYFPYIKSDLLIIIIYLFILAFSSNVTKRKFIYKKLKIPKVK